MQNEDERAEDEVAAEQRRALRAALQREHDGYVTRGLEGRAHQVAEQLKALDGQEHEAEGEGGGEGGGEERVAAGPVETAVESKPRSTAGRGRGK